MFQPISFLRSIEYVPLQRMIYRQFGMIKSILRITLHANFLHHSEGRLIQFGSE